MAASNKTEVEITTRTRLIATVMVITSKARNDELRISGCVFREKFLFLKTSEPYTCFHKGLQITVLEGCYNRKMKIKKVLKLLIIITKTNELSLQYLL